MTQVQLAGLVGVGQSRVSEWRAGKSMPQRRVAEELAEQLYLNVDWLLEGEGPKTPEQRSKKVLMTAKKIADKAKDAGLSDRDVQVVFEISERTLKADFNASGNDWQTRALAAEERALVAERELAELKARLSGLIK